MAGRNSTHRFLFSGENWSIGTSDTGMYGECREKSLGNAFDILEKKYALDESSVFMDLGSGRGVPSILAASMTKCLASLGIEMDEKASMLSLQNLKKAHKHRAEERTKNSSSPSAACSSSSSLHCAFGCMDGTMCLDWSPVTHMYSFDCCMPLYMIDQFVRVFNHSETCFCFASFRKDLISLFSLDGILAEHVSMQMTGSSEGRQLYIYLKHDWEAVAKRNKEMFREIRENLYKNNNTPASVSVSARMNDPVYVTSLIDARRGNESSSAVSAVSIEKGIKKLYTSAVKGPKWGGQPVKALSARDALEGGFLRGKDSVVWRLFLSALASPEVHQEACGRILDSWYGAGPCSSGQRRRRTSENEKRRESAASSSRSSSSSSLSSTKGMRKSENATVHSSTESKSNKPLTENERRHLFIQRCILEDPNPSDGEAETVSNRKKNTVKVAKKTIRQRGEPQSSTTPSSSSSKAKETAGEEGRGGVSASTSPSSSSSSACVPLSKGTKRGRGKGPEETATNKEGRRKSPRLCELSLSLSTRLSSLSVSTRPSLASASVSPSVSVSSPSASHSSFSPVAAPPSSRKRFSCAVQ